MIFKRTPGAAGNIHPSEAEAKLSFPFFNLGILSNESFYPEPFADGEGATFPAKRDFMDSYVEAIAIETKSGSMNGLKTCGTAANAMARFYKSYADGFVSEDDYDFLKLMASWSASVPKFKCVQLQEAAAGRVVILVFGAKPPPETFNRLEKAKVLWCIFGDANWYTFNQFRLHARLGIQSTFTIKGHILEANGGAEYVEDFPRTRLTKKEAVSLMH